MSAMHGVHDLPGCRNKIGLAQARVRRERTNMRQDIRVGRGPRPDVDELVALLSDALRSMLLKCLSADAGYDSEANHRFARERCGVRTLIPAKHGRPTDKPASEPYRRLMQARFDVTKYHRRVQVEAVISMPKRRQGALPEAAPITPNAATSA